MLYQSIYPLLPSFFPRRVSWLCVSDLTSSLFLREPIFLSSANLISNDFYLFSFFSPYQVPERSKMQSVQDSISNTLVWKWVPVYNYILKPISQPVLNSFKVVSAVLISHHLNSLIKILCSAQSNALQKSKYITLSLLL